MLWKQIIPSPGLPQKSTAYLQSAVYHVTLESTIPHQTPAWTGFIKIPQADIMLFVLSFQHVFWGREGENMENRSSMLRAGVYTLSPTTHCPELVT